MRIKQSIIICFGMALILMTVGTATASTITVNNSTGQVADFTSIQAAIDDVNTINGDTISVYPGTYTENVDVYKELTIISKSGNPDDTHVKAADPNDDIFYVTADGVNISGFNVTGATGSGKAGIYLDGVQGCSISNNTLPNNDYGIYLLYSSNNTLRNNTANSNYWHGIYLLYSSNNTLSNNTANSTTWDGIALHGFCDNNTLNNNTANSNNRAGILLYSFCDNNTLSDNTVSNNVEGITLYNSCDNNTLSNNTVSNNVKGIEMGGSSNNNTILDNTASDNNYGIYFYVSSDNTIYNNYFNNTNNVGFEYHEDDGNAWNITKTPGTNIVGGPFLGGNFWANTTGTGFSQINVDTDGDGFCDSPENEYVFDGNTDYLPLAEYIQATIDIDPDTLNLESKGKFITVYIELSGSYLVEDINVSSVTLTNESLFGSPLNTVGTSEIGDYDGDGISDLMVKFDRQELILLLDVGNTELTASGELVDVPMFEGTDTIRVI